MTHLPGWFSLQFNWYTRRAVLAAIYNTTELVMMQDSSPDFEDTWRFLENRINDAMNMGHTANQVVGLAIREAASPGTPSSSGHSWALSFSCSPVASADSPEGLPRELGWFFLIAASPRATLGPFAAVLSVGSSSSTQPS